MGKLKTAPMFLLVFFCFLSHLNLSSRFFNLRFSFFKSFIFSHRSINVKNFGQESFRVFLFFVRFLKRRLRKGNMFLFKKIRIFLNKNIFGLSKKVFKVRRHSFTTCKKFFVLYNKIIKIFLRVAFLEREKIVNKRVVRVKHDIFFTVKKKFKSFFFNKDLLCKHKIKYLYDSLTLFDPVFFSFIFSKFLNKCMIAGKRMRVYFIVLTLFFLIKFFTAIKPFFLFFSAIESSRVMVGHIPKSISGRVHIVPTFLFFDKQVKLALKHFVSAFLKKQEFISPLVSGASYYKTKRLFRFSSLMLKTQKIYFSKFSKFVYRKNFVFDVLKKNYYLYLSNRSNLQYRWR